MNHPNHILPTSVFIAAVLGTTILLTLFNDIDAELSTDSFVIRSYTEEIAWISCSMLMIFIFMHTDTYKKIVSDNVDLRSMVFGTLMFGNLATLGCVAGTVGNLTLFNFFPIMLLLAGFYGGPRIGLLSALYCIAISFLASNITLDVDTWQYGLMIISAAMGSILRLKSYAKPVIWLAPLILSVLYVLPLNSYVSTTSFPHINKEVLFECSAIALFIGTYYALALDRMFHSIMEMRESSTRSEKDLSASHDIQMAALPTEFPVSRTLDIYAKMTPATEVGGDFYDCFLVSRNLTAFVVADVSDKGLPASMLMMRMMGSFKVAATLSNDPGRILTAVNEELCRNNPADQFLTAWLGIFDSDTGILQYANAGHTPPYIRRASGRFEKLEVKKGPIIGFSNAARYKTSQITLLDGDAVFSYTDGVNEAFNSEGEQFGQERLCDALNASEQETSEQLVKRISDSVSAFTDGFPASDDITMLTFLVHRPRHGFITVPGNVENLDSVNGFIEEILTDGGCPMKQILKMQIVAEEIFVNICDHAYENTEGDVDVYCRFYQNEIKLTFCDDAAFFNPINKEEIEIDEDVGNWPIGGFGIHMIKKLVTYMDYKHFAGKNIFTVWKMLPSEEKE